MEPLHHSQIAGFIAAARQGSDAALGQALDAYRLYLLQMANEELPSDVRTKMASSDVVQQTFLEAKQDFGQFEGQTATELMTWLRRILQNNLINATRHFRLTAKRDVAREVTLPGGASDGELAANDLSPSQQLMHREELESIESALAKLPEEYQQVIRLRNQQRLSFVDIGQQMNRSASATRKLWTRAVERLRVELESR